MSQVRTRNEKSRPVTPDSGQSTSPGVAPIHSLPDEVLTIVFQVVYRFRPCAAGLACCGLRSPERLVALSHVCGRWRRLVINSRTLWTHINLNIGGPNWHRTLDRAEVYADRASDIPLHIALAIHDSVPEWDQVSARVEKLLGLVAAQVKHLEAWTSAIDSVVDPLHNFRGRILSALLEGCTPGVLTKITLGNWDNPHFISSSEDAWSDTDWQLSTPHERLERIWEHITVLQTDGLFPYWTSKAYHNLVELHIQATGQRPMDLPEPRLVEILKSSPGLRAIHLNISLVDALPPGAPAIPVALESLEVLSIESNDHERIIQWFAPGPAFLKLSVSVHFIGGDFIVNENIVEFLKQSKKAGLKILRVFIPPTEIIKALYQIPGLRTLELSACVVWLREGRDSGLASLDGYRPTVQTSCLLYLYECITDYDAVQWISGQNLAKRVILAECDFGSGSMDRSDVSQANERGRFSSRPDVELLNPGEAIEFSAAWDWPDHCPEDTDT